MAAPAVLLIPCYLVSSQNEEFQLMLLLSGNCCPEGGKD